jgi:RNA polymerase sigma factor (sigma-70 family)
LVFSALARSAAKLSDHQALTAWLYTATRNHAVDAIRAEHRRAQREQEFHRMSEQLSPATDPEDWSHIEPLIDETMDELPDDDRSVVLLRFFSGRRYSEIGEALEVEEDAARMRVNRALDKLRAAFARRGITSSSAALAAALAAHASGAAPVGLAANIAATALLGTTATATAATGTITGALHIMTKTKLAGATLALVIAMGAGVLIGHRWATRDISGPIVSSDLSAITRLRTENSRLKGELDFFRARRAVTTAFAGPTSGSAPASLASPVAVLRRLWEMQGEKQVSVKMNRFLDPSGKLAEGFVAMLELTPTEQADVQRAVDQARERLAEYERANSTVNRNEDGSVTIATKPFPDSGGAVFDQLMNAIGAVLGSDRNAVFRSFGQEQIETEFARFGAVQRTITFSANSANPGRPYSLHEVQTTGPNSTSTRAFDFSTLDALKAQAGTIVRLLPGDFGRKK